MKFRLFYLDYPFKKRRIYLRFLSVLTGDFNHFQLKLCKTNPIFKTTKMNVTILTAITTNKKQRTMNYLKQTQTKPILSALVADKIVPSTIEGPIISMIYTADKIAPPVRRSFSEDGSVAERPTFITEKWTPDKDILGSPLRCEIFKFRCSEIKDFDDK
jgi:hypothetical protein